MTWSGKYDWYLLLERFPGLTFAFYVMNVLICVRKGMPSSAPILQLQDTTIPLRGHVSWVFATFTANAWGFLFGVWVDIFSGNPFKWMTVRKESSALVVSKTAFIVGENDQWWVLQLVYSSRDVECMHSLLRELRGVAGCLLMHPYRENCIT